MTKIKDLAVLAVESAFTLFPVDSERYELMAQIIRIASGAPYELSGQWDGSEDWRVNQWITGQNRLFRQVALDFNWSMSSHLRRHLSKIGLDRARRCEATLRFWLVDARWTRVCVARPEVICSYLWECLLVACDITGDFSSTVVPNGHGGNP